MTIHIGNLHCNLSEITEHKLVKNCVCVFPNECIGQKFGNINVF